MEAWASAVVGDEPGQGAQRWGGKQRGKQMGRSPPPRSSWWGGAPRKPALAAWDQEPINKLVIQRGMVVDPQDRLLVSTFERTLSLGILPMLQFTTAFTYFIHRDRRESLGVPPYSPHAPNPTPHPHPNPTPTPIPNPDHNPNPNPNPNQGTRCTRSSRTARRPAGSSSSSARSSCGTTRPPTTRAASSSSRRACRRASSRRADST